jgi:hypothetical protein
MATVRELRHDAHGRVEHTISILCEAPPRHWPRALRLPADAAGKTIHVVLEVTDAGTPPLTRYRRLVVTGE